MNPSKERTYLIVPFVEREQAYGVGAHWDETAGAWYVPASSDLQHVSRWLSDDDALRIPDIPLIQKIRIR